MSQIVGYTGPINAPELKRLKDSGYLPDDLLGKTGVEATYEDQLRGTYGSQTVEVNALGREVQVLQTTQQMVPGDSLVLTIDMKEQRLAQQAVEWAMQKAGLKRAVMIVENPRSARSHDGQPLT
jgi:penicillin-binding protein 2